jgi:hypothetical protein
MSRVDILKEARSTVAVKFLEFLKSLAADKNITTVFFEGEDEKYYSVRLNTVTPNLKWRAINAEGKRNVLKLREKIRSHSEYSDKSCIFIVDADFDDNKELSTFSDTYVTPCYSVENLYVSVEVLKRVLSAEFKITEFGEESESYEKALVTFERLQQEYLHSILPFNIWIRAYRKNEQHEKLPGLNINNLNFDSLIEVKLTGVSKKYDDDSISKLFPETTDPQKEFIEDSTAYFACRDHCSHFRGKQQLEFFRVFIDKLKNDCNSKINRLVFANKGKVTLALTKANTLSELSNYAETPECLISFLSEFGRAKFAA